MSRVTATEASEGHVSEADSRPLRADARRNRERVLATATAVFAEQGADASVAEIARRAGVGAGTLFRHFPTKRDLLLASLASNLDDIRVAIVEAEALQDPWEGLVHVFYMCAAMQARDRAFLETVGPELFREPSLERVHEELMAQIATLMQRGQASGQVRDDLRPEDVPFLLCAVGGVTGKSGASTTSPDLWRRYLGIVLDGMRPEGASPLPVRAPTLAELTTTPESVTP